MSATTDLEEARRMGVSTVDITTAQNAASNLEAARILGTSEKDTQTARNRTATVPATMAAPTAVAVAGRIGRVSFTAPANGGQPISGYTVTSSPGGFTGTGTTSPIDVTGLTVSTAYTFTIRATNEIGQSVASPASNSITALA